MYLVIGKIQTLKSKSVNIYEGLLYIIQIMVYIGVIYNKVSSQVLCDLTHKVSMILVIYKRYDHTKEDFFEKS